MMSSEARRAGKRVFIEREKNLEHSSPGWAVVTLATARTTNESRGTVCTDAEVWYRWRHKRFKWKSLRNSANSLTTKRAFVHSISFWFWTVKLNNFLKVKREPNKRALFLVGCEWPTHRFPKWLRLSAKILSGCLWLGLLKAKKGDDAARKRANYH